MNFQFRKIEFIQNPPRWQPNKLKVVSEKNVAENLSNLKIPKSDASLPRSVDAIISDIQNEQADNITQLEWVYLLYAKTQWDNENPDISREISQLIWQIAKHHVWLKSRLFWRLALYYSQVLPLKEMQDNSISAYSILPLSLVETFDEFAIRATGNDGLPVQIINTLSQDEAGQNIANISWQYLRTPQEILSNAQLPTWIPQARMALDYITEIFIRNQGANKTEVEWLLRCLKQMSSEQKLAAVEELLTKVSPSMVNHLSKLVEWLSQEYDVSNNDSRSHQLSDSAQANLSRWIGTVNYSYFQTLIDLLVRMLALPDEERHQLEERREFWANYSDRIQRIRLLLPASSVKELGYQLQLSVDTLTEDKYDPTEICIFDLGNYFIVEFLRGIGGEARLVAKTPNNELLLFGPSKLSVKKLRQLSPEVCDRVFQWQPNCEQWLRQKNIYPNPGVEYFQGLPKARGRFDRQNGLPFPSAKEQKERDIKLKQWQRDIEKLEREAKGK